MAVLTVLHEPDKRLRKISKPVDIITPEIISFIQDMVDTMYEQEGIGLAAPQVNVHKRIIVLQAPTSLEDNREKLPLYKMINPVIVQRSIEMCGIEEYCLSVPGEGVEIERSYRITVEYMDEKGIAQRLEAENILSICIQHEIDHLDGRLIIDSLSPLKKKVALKRLTKRKQDEE
jgi:peptide deformylase